MINNMFNKILVTSVFAFGGFFSTNSEAFIKKKVKISQDTHIRGNIWFSKISQNARYITLVKPHYIHNGKKYPIRDFTSTRPSHVCAAANILNNNTYSSSGGKTVPSRTIAPNVNPSNLYGAELRSDGSLDIIDKTQFYKAHYYFESVQCPY